MNQDAPLCARQKLLASVPLCVCLLLVGCFPLPVRFPTQTTDAMSQKIDLTFLKAGSTTREEVSKKLASIDTGVDQKELFWGRPRVSKYREILMVGYVPVGPLDRMWGLENLLVSYDPTGVVKNFVVVSDSHLLHALDAVDFPAGTALDLSSPLTLDSVSYWVHEKHKPPYSIDGPLMLDAESLECFGIKVPRNELRGIAVQKANDPSLLLKIQFGKPLDFSRTPLQQRRDHLDLSLEPRKLLLLRRYMNQTRAGTR